MSKTIGERLKEAREGAKLTQDKVCKLVGIPKNQTLSAYERNVNNPPLETLAKLAKLYRVSIDWIVCGEEAEHKQEKTTVDYIRDLFTTIDRLNLNFYEDEDPFNPGTSTGRFVVRLMNSELQGFDDLIVDLYRISSIKGAIDDDDYKMLVQKKIDDYAKEFNNFEKIPSPQKTVPDIFAIPEDGTLPF